MRSRRLGALLFAPVMAASFALSTGCGEEGDSTISNGSSTSSIATQGTAPSVSTLAQSFGVLRRIRTKSDVIPSDLVPRDIARQVGLDLSTSRLARKYRGHAIYVVGAPRLICLYSGYNPVGNCWPNSVVEEGLATYTAICGLGAESDEVVTSGIVPDGIEKVTILRRKEPDRTVPVLANVYVAVTSSIPPLPTHLSFVLDGRRTVRSTGIPSEVARQGCSTEPPSNLPPPSP